MTSTIQKVKKESLVSDEEIRHDFDYLADHYLILPSNRSIFFKTIREAYDLLCGSTFAPLPVEEITEMVVSENVNILSSFSELTKSTCEEVQEKTKKMIRLYLDCNINIRGEVERILDLFHNIWDSDSEYLRIGQAILFLEFI